MIENEKKILDAACKVFIAKGFDGARMQEIADEAGINKSLLHYYYRSKDNLFELVFVDAFRGFFPVIEGFFSNEGNLFDKIRLFTGGYISLIQNNPHIPMFILHELNKNSEKLPQIIDAIANIRGNDLMGKLNLMIEKEVSEQKIRKIEARQLFVNIISLSIFPIVAKPIVCAVLFENNEEKYNQFIENRKTEVAEFIINSIKI